MDIGGERRDEHGEAKKRWILARLGMLSRREGKRSICEDLDRNCDGTRRRK